MGKVDENKEQKRRSLLDTAFSLFTTKGITKTSISEIVENAGVAKGTFYLYFKDKYDIEEKLIAYKANQLFQHALNTSDYNSKNCFEEKLLAIIDDILAQMQKNHGLVRFVNKNLSWGIFSHALTTAHPDTLQAIETILYEDGRRWSEPNLMIYTIVELVSASCYSVILHKDPTDLDSYKPYLHRSILSIVHSFEET